MTVDEKFEIELPVDEPAVELQKEDKPSEDKPNEGATFEQIRNSVSEEDSAVAGTPTLRKILGGDLLSSDIVRRQVWLILLIVFFIVVYVAYRYQCQQDMIAIDKLEKELQDAKYKALSSSSNLTEKCRESRVLEVLRANQDSTLHASDQPPYIINVPEE